MCSLNEGGILVARLHILKNGVSFKEVELIDGMEYIGGRGDSCQISLEDEAISRHHFKITKESNGWQIEKLSKYGILLREGVDIQTHSLNKDDSFSIPPFYFRFHDNGVTEQPRIQLENEVDEDFEPTAEIIEATSVESSRAIPYLTISKPGADNETLRLEGVMWTIGRDDAAEVMIDDRKSSRKHFKIYFDRGNYYVQDLESSNGTYLNNEKLNREPRMLESGDTIMVGDTALTFEVRDPTLEAELNNLPAPYSHQPGPSVVYMPIDLSIAENPVQGVIRVDKKWFKDYKSKQFRIVVGAILAIALAYSFMGDNSGQQSNASKNPKNTKSPFDNLSSQDQEFVRRTHTLAKNLYMQLKYELALNEIKKVHEKVPSFLDSKEIETLCESAILSIKNKQYEEDIEKKQKEAIAQAKQIIEMCTQKYANSSDLEAVETCLAPATELDPESFQARQLIEKARALLEEKNLEKTNRAEYLRRIKVRESLFQQAKNLQAKGQLMDAIETYERHIASTLPDPNNLQDKSKKGIQSIRSEVEQIMSSATQDAEKHVSNSDYKEAVDKLERALELEPNNAKARSLYDMASKELFKKMKALYSDAVVEESLGNVDAAKIKWKKIVDQDINKGDYRAKAIIKLRKYGE